VAVLGIATLCGVAHGWYMKKKTDNHTDHPYDNGAIGAIGSVASAGAAVGASIGIAVGLPEILIGCAIGGTAAAVGSLIIAEEMDHPEPKPTKKDVKIK